MSLDSAYSASKDCQSGCDHLQQGSCRPCVEKALTAFAESYAEERVKTELEWKVKEMLSDHYLMAHWSKARAEALEEAAEIAEKRDFDGETGESLGIADAIRALKGK